MRIDDMERTHRGIISRQWIIIGPPLSGGILIALFFSNDPVQGWPVRDTTLSAMDHGAFSSGCN